MITEETIAELRAALEEATLVKEGIRGRMALAALSISARNHLPALLDDRQRLVEENARLREENSKLTKISAGQWFYPADGHDSEQCMWSPSEVIDWLDLEPGQHVVEVNVATPLPSIWCAVSVTADEDADERFTFTEHGTSDDARAALGDPA